MAATVVQQKRMGALDGDVSAHGDFIAERPVLPPGFRVSAPAAGELPAATYETARAVTVRAELNELRPFLSTPAAPPPTAGTISAAVEALQTLPEVVVPGLKSFADVLSGRFEAGRLTTLAARTAARWPGRTS